MWYVKHQTLYYTYISIPGYIKVITSNVLHSFNLGYPLLYLYTIVSWSLIICVYTQHRALLFCSSPGLDSRIDLHCLVAIFSHPFASVGLFDMYTPDASPSTVQHSPKTKSRMQIQLLFCFVNLLSLWTAWHTGTAKSTGTTFRVVQILHFHCRHHTNSFQDKLCYTISFGHDQVFFPVIEEDDTDIATVCNQWEVTTRVDESNSTSSWLAKTYTHTTQLTIRVYHSGTHVNVFLPSKARAWGYSAVCQIHETRKVEGKNNQTRVVSVHSLSNTMIIVHHLQHVVGIFMAKSVLAMPLPPAGMTTSYAAAKSKPAASGEPRTGIVACSVNFLINKTSSWAMVDIVRNSRKIFGEWMGLHWRFKNLNWRENLWNNPPRMKNSGIQKWLFLPPFTID